ncbi:MAG: tRNA uridine(34) 5-carboxymethylaminomethyl modification radical SAM/GNAT enzyme Elp3 [Methanomicrobiales archaeon]|nr:tRNA uridine(34) 5-carboxymethylaminomethyl modification radical SAM/GNAT enzyme Elp3 [Methanomicrobiales archaeon]
MKESTVFREIISRIFQEDPLTVDVQRIKIAVSREFGLASIPKNSAILAAADDDEREHLRRILQLKPTRTISGVAPVAVMTSPYPCPHGRCLPCPGGPDHPFGSPQSYTGEEPAALRAREHDYDPYRQVQARLAQFESLGHRVEKAELIVMGGTMTARDPEYQEWFMRSCIRAMNEYGGEERGDNRSFEVLCTENEGARVRCVATTFETRPDWSRRTEIDRMLALGVTKVELGVQQIDDRILALNRRGHGVAETAEANRLLRDAGIKVGFHVMPNLPGAGIDDDRRMFDALFADERFKPDFIKIYPTLVTPGSEIEELWRRGEYRPYEEQELVELIAYAKSRLPEYVRLQRIQRDIPAKLIVAGSRHSNFRQLAKKHLEAEGGRCRCIRCREVGRAPLGGPPELGEIRYACAGGEERFISFSSDDALVGFVRLRFPAQPWREELADGAALVRELHVYGAPVPIGSEADEHEWQHRRFGNRLLARAEEGAAEAGYRRMAVMSGIGVRPYYRRQGYERTGPYMVKRLV